MTVPCGAVPRSFPDLDDVCRSTWYPVPGTLDMFHSIKDMLQSYQSQPGPCVIYQNVQYGEEYKDLYFLLDHVITKQPWFGDWKCFNILGKEKQFWRVI